ncbi:pilus assembly protein TadG-related protein [Youngiibacter fragilis]|uniref:Putative Flp pilus-assembly TadG-like N-terminal domain-containing protein n=1 Tax=Youngiibacter fragilis 232.1 TaxID=994573 RepID=V7I5F9_9CLOT|nr:pilus assembly protein TadG-related protein [Youngiibacter fragilis]ETA81485.1 hypothetical protein T472_0206195 [Youngiibacter fragilis 232.1]
MKLGLLKKLFKNDEGSVVVIVAVMMTVFMGFAAIVIDAGFMYGQRRALQNAADAGALAGAMERSIGGNYVKVAKDAVQQNRNIPSEDITVTPVGSNKVRVEVTQVAPKIFAGFLTDADSSVWAAAEAEKIRWAGDALPFVNLDDLYINPATNVLGGTIEAWEKLKGGVFESIWKDDLEPVNEKEPGWEETSYFDISYEDGITITRGVVTNSESIGKILQFIYDRQVEGGKVYLFSLSNDSIASNTVIAKPNNPKDAPYIEMSIIDFKGKSELGEQWTIHPDSLVLLECTFDELKLTGNNPRLILTVTDSYTLKAGDIPDDYIMPGMGSAKLTD